MWVKFTDIGNFCQNGLTNLKIVGKFVRMRDFTVKMISFRKIKDDLIRSFARVRWWKVGTVETASNSMNGFLNGSTRTNFNSESFFNTCNTTIPFGSFDLFSTIVPLVTFPSSSSAISSRFCIPPCSSFNPYPPLVSILVIFFFLAFVPRSI